MASTATDTPQGASKLRTYLESTLGGKWHWIHSFTGTGKYVPVLTLALCLLLLIFFAVPGSWDSMTSAERDRFTFRRDPNLKAETVLLSFACHVNLMHLIFNVFTLFLAGVFLELTEGSIRLALIAWGGQTLSMGLHGAMDGRSVVGASGVGYGFMWAQLALLCLNWREMPFRYTRLAVLAALGLFDVGSILLNDGMEDTMATWAHVGGALGSISVAVVTAVNVRREKWEWIPNCLGVITYFGLVVWVMAGDETKAGVLAGCLLFVLIPWAMFDLRPLPSQRSAPPEEELGGESPPLDQA